MNVRDTENKLSCWKPAPLTYVMAALAGWCAVLRWLGFHRQVTSSDPAGNGMATGFVHGFAEVGLQATAILTALFVLIRWRPARIACVTSLLVLSLGMIILVR
jgi:hypothetical protein